MTLKPWSPNTDSSLVCVCADMRFVSPVFSFFRLDFKIFYCQLYTRRAHKQEEWLGKLWKLQELRQLQSMCYKSSSDQRRMAFYMQPHERPELGLPANLFLSISDRLNAAQHRQTLFRFTLVRKVQASINWGYCGSHRTRRASTSPFEHLVL